MKDYLTYMFNFLQKIAKKQNRQLKAKALNARDSVKTVPLRELIENFNISFPHSSIGFVPEDAVTYAAKSATITAGFRAGLAVMLGFKQVTRNVKHVTTYWNTN